MRRWDHDNCRPTRWSPKLAPNATLDPDDHETTLPRLLTRLGDTNSLPLTPSTSQFKSLHNTYSWLRHCSYSLHPQRCSHHSYSLLISLVDVRSVLQRQVLVTRSTLGGLDLLALITYATSLGLLAYTDNLRNDAGHVYTVAGQTSVVNNVQKQQHGPINYATITTLQVSNLDQDRSHCRKGSPHFPLNYLIVKHNRPLKLYNWVLKVSGTCMKVLQILMQETSASVWYQIHELMCQYPHKIKKWPASWEDGTCRESLNDIRVSCHYFFY